MADFLKKKFRFQTQILILSLVVVLAVGLGTFLWLQHTKKPQWSSNWQEIFRTSHQPIILAIVKQSCNDETQTDCPTPDKQDLSGFKLVEVLYSSQEYIELGYDDRFTLDREEPPVFFLLNPDGEIRDVQKKFPDRELLERWKRIR